MRGTPSDDPGRAGDAPVSPACSNGQLWVVLQVRSEGGKVHKEARRAVRATTEVSRACEEHALAIERLAYEGKPLPWIAEAVRCTGMGKWRQSYQRDNCDKFGLARLRVAEAQPADPSDKKHLILKTSEIKWRWRCGARTERKQCAMSVVEERPRAVAHFAPRSAGERFPFVGLASPICDEEWGVAREPRQLVFLSPRAVEAEKCVSK